MLFVDTLDANLGGTEMEAAIAKTLSLPAAMANVDILLITDGEVWNYEAIASPRP